MGSYFQQPTCCQQIGVQNFFLRKGYVNSIGGQSAWNLWNLFRRSLTGNVIARPILQLHDRSITSTPTHPSETSVDINVVHRLCRRKRAPTNGGRSGIKIVRNLQRMFHSVRIQAKRFS